MAETRGRKSNQELGEPILATTAMVKFAKAKAAQFWTQFVQTLKPAQEAYEQARSGTAKPLMEIGARAYEMATKAGYAGSGESDKNWSLVQRYWNSLCEPFEVELKELSGESQIVKACPSYPPMKSAVLAHLKTGPYIIAKGTKRGDVEIPDDERILSTGNPKDSAGFADMEKRTKHVRSLRKTKTRDAQSPAAPGETAATGVEDRIAIAETLSAAVQKAFNDLAREINAVPRWDDSMATQVVIRLQETRVFVGNLKPAADTAALPDASPPPVAKVETNAVIKANQEENKAPSKKAQARAARRAAKGAVTLRDAA